LDTPVALLDIVPTVLDLAGITVPPDLGGISLIPFGTAMVPPDHPPVFIEMLKDATHSDRRAIVEWPFKLQYGITFDEYTLYDLIQDPEEQRNLVKLRPKVFSRLQSNLRQWMSQDVKPVKPSITDDVLLDDTAP
jgi:arylsulfatase A-like enzyme